MRDVVAAGGRVVVLGAGVLGIELGMLLAKAGASPSIAHFGPIPMPRQLDRGSAAVLGAAMEDAGLHVIPHTRAEAIVARVDEHGERRFHALVSSDGRVTEGDLLVLSCGVAARTELAAAAGLRVGAGILVDERLRTWTDPVIHAIGDCAHIADPARYLHEASVPGGPSGLIGPGWRQAEWLARVAARRAARRDHSPVRRGSAGSRPAQGGRRRPRSRPAMSPPSRSRLSPGERSLPASRSGQTRSTAPTRRW